MGRWGDGEMGRWGDGEEGEQGRWGDGEMGKRGSRGGRGEFINSTLHTFSTSELLNS
jgi:hypothetical protein